MKINLNMQVQQVMQFATTLNSAGIETTIRREMGRDISAACGQLRYRQHKSEDKPFVSEDEDSCWKKQSPMVIHQWVSVS